MSPETIDAMLTAGASAEVIAAAWKSEIAEQTKRLTERRAKDCERQRRKRHAVSRGVTRTRRDTADTPSPDAPLNGFPTPLPNNPPLSPNPSPPIPDGIGPQPPDKPVTVNEIVEAWNERMVKQGFPAVKRLTDARRKQLQARLRENTLDDWQTAFAAIERSAFLRGENDRGWRADFDFLLQPKSFTKLLEGAYDH